MREAKGLRGVQGRNSNQIHMTESQYKSRCTVSKICALSFSGEHQLWFPLGVTALQINIESAWISTTKYYQYNHTAFTSLHK